MATLMLRKRYMKEGLHTPLSSRNSIESNRCETRNSAHLKMIGGSAGRHYAHDWS